MWWAEARNGKAKVRGTPVGRTASRLGVASAAVAALLVSACTDGGFRPLYGTASLGGAGASEKLAQVEVAPIPGRVGQQIRNEVIFQTTGGGHPLPAAYRLEIAMQESISSTLVKISGDASGSVYTINATFRLVRIGDKKVVLEGNSISRASFERFTSVFSNVRARRDAEDRAARTISSDLKTRLAAYLAQAALAPAISANRPA